MEWENTNKMLFKGFDGVKTGITIEAGHCLCSYYKREGKELLIVLLGCPTSEARWIETWKIKKWGVENFEMFE